MTENILMDDVTEADSGHHNGKGSFYIFYGLFCQIRVQLFMTGWQLNPDTGIYQEMSLLQQNFLKFCGNPMITGALPLPAQLYLYYEPTMKYSLMTQSPHQT